MKRLEVIVGDGAEFRGNDPGLIGVRVRHADQFHVRETRQDAGVVLSQVADADYRHPKPSHVSPIEVEYRKVERRKLASRQAARLASAATW